jgi:DNA-binding response OmpR family regulator
MMKILLLEDDRILSDSLKEYLEYEGYHVDTAERGSEVYDLTFSQSYDLYIFDVNVPEDNGFEVYRALRESGDTTPVIYTTALTDIGSISHAFEIGAEDYIKKPFDPEELVIRIKSRYDKQGEEIHYQDIVYDPHTKMIRKGTEHIALGKVQQQLFHMLITRQGEVVDTFSLMECLEQPNANALRVNLAKIKSKLDIEIKNIRGQGYMLENI